MLSCASPPPFVQLPKSPLSLPEQLFIHFLFVGDTCSLVPEETSPLVEIWQLEMENVSRVENGREMMRPCSTSTSLSIYSILSRFRPRLAWPRFFPDPDSTRGQARYYTDIQQNINKKSNKYQTYYHMQSTYHLLSVFTLPLTLHLHPIYRHCPMR